MVLNFVTLKWMGSVSIEICVAYCKATMVTPPTTYIWLGSAI